MDSAYKLILLFLVIFFLIINARTDQPANETVALADNGFKAGQHYGYVAPEKKDTYR